MPDSEAPPAASSRLVTGGLSVASVWAIAAGALLGLVAAPAVHEAWRSSIWPAILGLPAAAQALLFMLSGGLAAFLLVRLWRWGKLGGSGLLISDAKVELPGVALTLKIDSRQREAGWRIFAELATRVATQPLTDREGRLREALHSLHQVFTRTREILTTAPPDHMDVAAGEVGIHAYAIYTMNLALRPFLARWHPLLSDWEAVGGSEVDWPLVDLCREDLEATRLRVLGYARPLGEALGVPNIDQVLDRPQTAPPALSSDQTIAERRRQAARTLTGPAAASAWRVLVELESRIATQPLPEEQGRLDEALASLHQVFRTIRDELKGLGPSHAEAGTALNEVLMHLLNQHLRPFLATWHPRLSAWRQANPDRPEQDWPDAAACRAQLSALSLQVSQQTAQLRRLLALPETDPAPPAA